MEHIHTIPVIDALRAPGECAFCSMYAALDKDAVDFIMGTAYMEDYIRMETDKIGFCKDHYLKMYGEQNRLGLALMTHTHLQRLLRDLEKPAKNTEKSGGRRLFQKNENITADVSGYINSVIPRCYVCDKINTTFDRYVDTFFYLWRTEKDIASMVKASRGFCLEHFSMLLNTGFEKLSRREHEDFVSIIMPIQMKSLKELENDLDWFIQKFDYRNAAEPWKNSADALPRALAKLTSADVQNT